MTDVSDITAAALEEGVFSFADAITDRAYPEFRVPVHLDEAKVQRLLEISDKLENLDDSITPEKLEELQEEHDGLADQINKDAFHVVVRGIAPDVYDSVRDTAYGVYPAEFEEGEHVVTGMPWKREIPNDERMDYYLNLLRMKHIVYIENAKGQKDDSFLADAAAFSGVWSKLPRVARVKIDEAIQKSVISVDYYRELADEVF